jgi:acetyl-CoA C-acetyltransferase
MSINAVIVSGARTPIGKFLGGLAPLKAPELGAIAVAEAMKRAGLGANDPEEVILGHVVQGGAGRPRRGRRRSRPASAPTWAR